MSFLFRLFYEPLIFHLSILVTGNVLTCPIEADRKLGNSCSIKRAAATQHQGWEMIGMFTRHLCNINHHISSNDLFVVLS